MYRIVPQSILGSGVFALQKRVGWKYFGIWETFHWEYMNTEPEMAYNKCAKIKRYLEENN